PAKYVIHTAGPIYQDGRHDEEELLRSCYLNSLRLAAENGCRSVALPLISSGIYGYPKAEAVRVAVGPIREFFRERDLYVYLVLFDKEAMAIGDNLTGQGAES